TPGALARRRDVCRAFATGIRRHFAARATGGSGACVGSGLWLGARRRRAPGAVRGRPGGAPTASRGEQLAVGRLVTGYSLTADSYELSVTYAQRAQRLNGSTPQRLNVPTAQRPTTQRLND